MSGFKDTIFPTVSNVAGLFSSSFGLPERAPMRQLPAPVIPSEAFAVSPPPSPESRAKRTTTDSVLPFFTKDSFPEAAHFDDDDDAMDIDAVAAPHNRSFEQESDPEKPDESRFPQEEEEEEEEQEDDEEEDDGDDDDDDDEDDDEEDEDADFPSEDADDEEEDEGDEGEEEEEEEASPVAPVVKLSPDEIRGLLARHAQVKTALKVGALPESFAHPSTISGVLNRSVPELGITTVANEAAIQRAIHVSATSHAKAAIGDQMSIRHLHALREKFETPSGATHDSREQIQKIAGAVRDLLILTQDEAYDKMMRNLLTKD